MYILFKLKFKKKKKKKKKKKNFKLKNIYIIWPAL